MVARMAQYRIAVLPEVTRLDKRIDGAADLKAFIDVLEDTLNWEIRMNVDVAEEGPKDGVSDVSDPPNGRP